LSRKILPESLHKPRGETDWYQPFYTLRILMEHNHSTAKSPPNWCPQNSSTSCFCWDAAASEGPLLLSAGYAPGSHESPGPPLPEYGLPFHQYQISFSGLSLPWV